MNYKRNKKKDLKVLFVSFFISLILMYFYFYSLFLSIIPSIFLTRLIYREYLKKKDKKDMEMLNYSILSLIQSLITSNKAGLNGEKAFIEANNELDISTAYILKNGINNLVRRLENNYNLKDSLNLLKDELNNEYMDLLVDSYISSYINGGNIIELMEEVEREIREDINYEGIIREEGESSFNQLLIMVFLPILVQLFLRTMGEIYVDINLTNMILKILVLLISIFSYKLGKNIIGLNI